MSRTRPDVATTVTEGLRVDTSVVEEVDVHRDQPADVPMASPRTIRHAHLYLTRVDPWSVMKSAFMLSIAIAIVLVVATMVVWTMLTASGTLGALTRTVDDIAGSADSVDLSGMLSFSRVLMGISVIAVMEVILVSALATLFAYLYNLAVAITGGLQVTLTEDN